MKYGFLPLRERRREKREKREKGPFASSLPPPTSFHTFPPENPQRKFFSGVFIHQNLPLPGTDWCCQNQPRVSPPPRASPKLVIVPNQPQNAATLALLPAAKAQPPQPALIAQGSAYIYFRLFLVAFSSKYLCHFCHSSPRVPRGSAVGT